MKNLLVIISLLFLISCENHKYQYSKNLNFDAAEAYFNLIDNVKAENELTKNQWINFLKVKGNRIYIEQNNIPKSTTENLRKIIFNVYSSKKK